MDRFPCNSLQNFDDPKTEILKKRLLKSSNTTLTVTSPKNVVQQNVLKNNLRPSISNSMLVSAVKAPQNSMPINNLVAHTIAPMKIHSNNSPYPLQLSTVHVPVQIPGSTSNINVPVQLSGPTGGVSLQITTPTVSVPMQGSCTTTNVPVQLPAGDTISVPLQLPTSNQNIQIAASLPSIPILPNTQQPLHSSIIHLHMPSNNRVMTTQVDGSADLNMSNTSQIQISESNCTSVKVTNSSLYVGGNPPIMQLSNTSTNPIQILPNPGHTGPIHLRGTARSVPQVVYIQTPAGLKPVTSSEVMSQANSSGNPPHIIVRRPIASASGIQLLSNKPNLAPKVTIPTNKSSILAPANVSQPIVIQKPKPNDKMIVPVTIASNNGKQAITYLGTMKKSNSTKLSDNQSSILLPNNQMSTKVTTPGNQKMFFTSMNMPKIQNTKFILPVTLPATMASKGPIINLQIANGQVQNDPQGNITVMSETSQIETTEMPPLQPLAKKGKVNCKESENAFAISIPGSRAESTGEQEYTLSIPETNASLNDDVYTVSIADENGSSTQENSFTLTIPEKSKSLLNTNIIEKDMLPIASAAPAILRRSNSDDIERKSVNMHLKRRISLCTDNISNKMKFNIKTHTIQDVAIVNTEDVDHKVPSLYCDEKLDRDLDMKGSETVNSQWDESENIDNKQCDVSTMETNENIKASSVRFKSESSESTSEEDPPGLLWSNGIAALQGSLLQFQTNEFGFIDVIDNTDEDHLLLNANAKYHTPLNQRIDRRDKKRMSPEDLYQCDGCACHGMAADFVTPNFCSLACQNEVQKLLQKKSEREKLDMFRKKNKLKKLLKKQQSDSSLYTAICDKEEKMSLKQFDSLPVDTILSEESVESEKYPWMCGKNGFSWMKYLECCKAKPAPVKLFKDPFPYNKNGFKVGMRLEAIDPSYPSLFCVVSVAEVQGYRMRLHFDESPEIYDYWVNADSIDIFPPGWCEKNGRTLRPPTNWNTATFSWPLYLKQMKAVAAPKNLFAHVSSMLLKPNGFRIGMKLEAEDRKNNLICVATVADMMDNRILVNFDSWDEMYDYWVDPTSPYIHPVGWAEENNRSLTPPNFYKDPDAFRWDLYLAETSAASVPARAFKTRLPVGYKPGMKVEAVDNRVPFLIRVATITEVKDYQVQISFDGWPEDLSYWLDDDSPDIHPVGWCLKTGHPLEPPLTAEEGSSRGPCGVGGCRGLGSLHGGAHKTHAAASACPYRAPPRPALQPRSRPAAERALPKQRRVTSVKPTISPTGSDRPRGRPPKHKVTSENKNESLSDEESVAKRGRCSTTSKDVEAEVLKEYPMKTDEIRVVKTLDIQPILERLSLPKEPKDWTESETSKLVEAIAGPKAGAASLNAQVRGSELLLATREELATGLHLRLGPALKLYSSVLQLRQRTAFKVF